MTLVKLEDIDFDLFSESEIVNHDDNGFSAQLNYNKRPLVFVTTFCKILWGVTKYTSKDGKFTNFSITIAVPDTKNNKPFLDFLKNMEDSLLEFVKTLGIENIDEYKHESPVRHPKENTHKHVHFRVKVPSNKTHLNIEIYEGKKKVERPTIAEGTDLLGDGKVVRMQLLLKPISFTNNANVKKFGISYQVLSVDIRSHAFDFD